MRRGTPQKKTLAWAGSSKKVKGAGGGGGYGGGRGVAGKRGAEQVGVVVMGRREKLFGTQHTLP